MLGSGDVLLLVPRCKVPLACCKGMLYVGRAKNRRLVNFCAANILRPQPHKLLPCR